MWGYAASLLSKTGVLLKGDHSQSCGVEVEERIPGLAPKRLQNSLRAPHRFQAHRRAWPGGLLLTLHAAASPGHGGYLTTCFVGADLPAAL